MYKRTKLRACSTDAPVPLDILTDGRIRFGSWDHLTFWANVDGNVRGEQSDRDGCGSHVVMTACELPLLAESYQVQRIL